MFPSFGFGFGAVSLLFSPCLTLDGLDIPLTLDVLCFFVYGAYSLDILTEGELFQFWVLPP